MSDTLKASPSANYVVPIDSEDIRIMAIEALGNAL